MSVIHADIRLLVDPIDHLTYFAIENLQISIADDDYSLNCSGLLGWLIELLKGVITGMMNDQIQGQLDDALSGALDDAVCLAYLLANPECHLLGVTTVAGNSQKRAEIVSVTDPFETPAGSFTNTLRTREGSGLNPLEREFKTYASGIGLIQDQDLLLESYGFVTAP